MGLSRHAIAGVAASLLVVLAMGGCSRAKGAGPRAEGLHSAIAGVSLVALADLPPSPEKAAVDPYCDSYPAETLSAVGRQVQSGGWIVTSEAPLGRYRVVSFASGFDPGTSAICTARNGNIGVFDGPRLVALAYTPRATGPILGTVEPLEDGGLMVWGGDYPGPPLGELRLDGDRPRLTALAPVRTFCHGAVSVPNIYGRSIDAARKDLLSHGWRPSPSQDQPDETGGTIDLVGRGVTEVQVCSGTGMGYCIFKYSGPHGALEVQTVGGSDEAENVVQIYDVACPVA